jgi:hypothetical protein
MTFLIMLPAAVIGFAGGAVFMWKNDHQLIRWQRRQIAKLQRRITEAPAPWME